MTGDLVDITLQPERLAAETGLGAEADAAAADRAWRVGPIGRRSERRASRTGHPLRPRRRRQGLARRPTLRLLAGHPGAAVDADGDVAVRVAPATAGRSRRGPADRRGPAGRHRPRRRAGRIAGRPSDVGRRHLRHQRPPLRARAHHLIDPRTRRPADTDVVQATVNRLVRRRRGGVRQERRRPGGRGRPDFLDRAGVAGAILLLDDGRVLALPRTTAFLA